MNINDDLRDAFNSEEWLSFEAAFLKRLSKADIQPSGMNIRDRTRRTIWHTKSCLETIKIFGVKWFYVFYEAELFSPN